MTQKEKKYSRHLDAHSTDTITRPITTAAMGSCSLPLTLLLGRSPPRQSSSTAESGACERVRSDNVTGIRQATSSVRIQDGRRKFKGCFAPFISADVQQVEDKSNPHSLFLRPERAQRVHVSRVRFEGASERRWAGQAHLLQGLAFLGVQRFVSASRGPRHIALEQRWGSTGYSRWRPRERHTVSVS